MVHCARMVSPHRGAGRSGSEVSKAGPGTVELPRTRFRLSTIPTEDRQHSSPKSADFNLGSAMLTFATPPLGLPIHRGLRLMYPPCGAI